jgi:signal transduction histidine kinase
MTSRRRDAPDAPEAVPGEHLLLSGGAADQQAGIPSEQHMVADPRAVEDFLSAISHDLKGPLSVMVIQAQLAQREVQDLTLRDGSRLPDHLAGIISMCQKMSGLIEDLLDVARVQLGQPVTLSLRPTDLVDLVGRVVDRKPHRAEPPLEFVPAVASLLIQADAPRLERLVGNLVGSALKVAPPETVVAVGVQQIEHRSGREAIMTISNAGPESLVAAWRLLLERFARLSTDPSVRDSLGLSWLSAAQVMAQHNGVIDVATGAGDPTLTLRFPLAS